MTRIGINGFGRIGRSLFRAIATRQTDVEVVGINDLTPAAVLAHFLRYDSTFGRFPGAVSATENELVVDGRSVPVVSQRDPAALPWKELGADVVVESTGLFTNAEDARKHITAGASKVVISAPATGDDITIVMGINDDLYDPNAHTIISNASCTTNCLAPLAKVLMDEFGIVEGMMVTVHAHTTEQQLLDQIAMTRKGTIDLRRTRAAGHNVAPTTTGAARAISRVLPDLDGKLSGYALRVPVLTGSITDLVVEVARPTTKDEVNAAFRRAAEESRLRGYLTYTEDPIVSSDIVADPASCIFDAQLTSVVGRHVRVNGWYDNEWGYANRLLDVAALVGSGR